MKNVFFDRALNSAARLSGNKGRITLLLGRLGKKMKTVNWNHVSISTAKEKLSVFSRMAQAYVSGKYRSIPWKTVMTILAAIIYFLNPLDLIPDFLPLMGLTDDFGVLVWVYNSVSSEINKFLEWEKSIPTT
ncbi:MAG TPA: YkvA family protein [Cyclobacteriaceae bacterium]